MKIIINFAFITIKLFNLFSITLCKAQINWGDTLVALSYLAAGGQNVSTTNTLQQSHTHTCILSNTRLLNIKVTYEIVFQKTADLLKSLNINLCIP